jgi:2-haloacid dehalogenase
VAYDIVGTLFSLEKVRSALTASGAPPHALEILFAESLRDYFALSHSGDYAPLKEVLQGSVRRSLAVVGVEAGDDQVAGVMAALPELDPSPGAAECVALFAEAGWRQMALTNGSEELTRGLLARAGLDSRVATVCSCDSIGVSKPSPRVYEMATEEAGGEELWLVAAHAWDTAGAARAGLRTAWVSSKEGRYLPAFTPPDVRAPDLAGAARAVLAERRT